MNKMIVLIFIAFTLNGFSQTKEIPVWRQMSRNGEYLKAVSQLLYKVQSDSTRNKHADYWHIAQNYGFLKDYEKAAFYLKKSMENQKEDNDKEFWWYYKGTLAFFKRNKQKLFENFKKLKKQHSYYYRTNYFTLKSLYENFDKNYKEASNWKKNKTN